jgi:hypothetical protein
MEGAMTWARRPTGIVPAWLRVLLVFLASCLPRRDEDAGPGIDSSIDTGVLADTGVGATREYAAPRTSRTRDPVSGSGGSSRRKALSKFIGRIRLEREIATTAREVNLVGNSGFSSHPACDTARSAAVTGSPGHVIQRQADRGQTAPTP